jgi:Predicted acyl-CoA transferases/carnitine dehydratase
MKRNEMPQFGNLQDYKVLSTGTNIAGPLVGSLFAEQGADVIQIESSLAPDLIRTLGDTWTVEHRNQRAISLDIPSAEGKEVLTRLIKWCDVLVESSKGGTWEKWGLTDDVLWGMNPRLVIAHVSGFGQSGDPDYTSRGSFDPIGQAFSGFVAINGMPEPEPPYAAKPYTCDYVTGLLASWAVAAALLRTCKTGVGESIDIAQFEAMARIQANFMTQGLNYGIQQPRLGSKGGIYSPIDNLQKCKDGNWVMLAIGGQGVFKKVEALWGLSDDPDFAEPHSTIRNTDGVRAEKFARAVTDFCQSHTAREVDEILNSIQVPCSIIMTYEMMTHNPHYQARETITEWEDPNTSRVVKGINTVPKFKNNPSQIFRGGPTYGMDNEDVLDELGYGSQEVNLLYEKGVIKRKQKG